MKELIEELETAKEGTRELDIRITEHIGESVVYSGHGSSITGRPEYFPPQPYTGSLDAALSLVPEGRSFSVGWDRCIAGPFATVDLPNSDGFQVAHCRTPVLSLVVAALKAREHASTEVTQTDDERAENREHDGDIAGTGEAT